MNWKSKPPPLAGDNERAPIPLPTDCECSRNALAIFVEALPLAGTLGEEYLIGRIRKRIDWPSDVRFHPSCATRFRADAAKRKPAIVALLRDVHTEKPRAIYCTFLLWEGFTRYASFGPVYGCALKLSKKLAMVRNEIGVAENLEDGLFMFARGDSPVWVTFGIAGTEVLFPYDLLP